MKRIKFGILFVLIGMLLISPSCGSGRGTPALDRGRPAPSNENPNPAVDDVSLPSRNVIVAQMPLLNAIPVGSEFNFILKGEFRDEVFQGSLRILFDEAVVSPVKVERGGLVPDSAVFFAKLDIPGVIPIAFTRLPGQSGISPGRGELLRVSFRLNSLPPPGFRIRLQNEPAFLQLRDKNRGRLSFDLATEVVSQ